MSERHARIALNAATEPGDRRVSQGVAQFGAEEYWEMVSSRGGGSVSADAAARLPRINVAEIEEKAAAADLRFVIPGDPEWPLQLDALDHVGNIQRRGGTPIGLWIRGQRPERLVGPSVAVVGARAATVYGEETALKIAAGVASAGWSVVSGAAFGIDQAAHRGALSVTRPTLAVLACGADIVYPAAHERLLEFIAGGGLVVSEASPGMSPTRIRFLARNRIIAGLAVGTLVVEAALRSGALNTANWAATLGRVTMAVPGPVTSAASAGAHQLIRQRGALLVTEAAEVVEAVSDYGVGTLPFPREPEKPLDRLGAEAREVYESVPMGIGVTVETIARAGGISAERVTAALPELLEQGFVERNVADPSLWRKVERRLSA